MPQLVRVPASYFSVPASLPLSPSRHMVEETGAAAREVTVEERRAVALAFSGKKVGSTAKNSSVQGKGTCLLWTVGVRGGGGDVSSVTPMPL